MHVICGKSKDFTLSVFGTIKYNVVYMCLILCNIYNYCNKLSFIAGDSVSVVSSVAVSVLRVVRGETRHPDPTHRGQNDFCQQHSLHDTVQASADLPCTGNR